MRARTGVIIPTALILLTLAGLVAMYLEFWPLLRDMAWLQQHGD